MLAYPICVLQSSIPPTHYGVVDRILLSVQIFFSHIRCLCWCLCVRVTYAYHVTDDICSSCFILTLDQPAHVLHVDIEKLFFSTMVRPLDSWEHLLATGSRCCQYNYDVEDVILFVYMKRSSLFTAEVYFDY